MRIFKLKAYLLLVFLCIAFLPVNASCSPLKKAKNIVLMIGDGMGFNHLNNADIYNEDKELFMKNKAVVVTSATTYSADSEISDSAASATALATGIKVNNGEIAYHNNNALIHLGDLAKTSLMGVGVIASEEVYGATPACFSSHNPSRSNIEAITQEQIAGNIDLFFGSGKDYYDQKSPLFEAYNRTYFHDVVRLENALQEVDAQEENVFFAAFSSIATIEEAEDESHPTLARLSLLALEYLSSVYQEQGFFLIIEGSHIDKKSHTNDLEATMEEVLAFDETVKRVVEWSNLNQETLVLVTSDHETGGLQYQQQSKDQLNNGLFTTTSHTSANVPVIMYQRFQNMTLPSNRPIDNTEIAIMLQNIFRDDV